MYIERGFLLQAWESDEDVAIVPAKPERIHQAIAGSELVRIPRAGHTSTIENPEEVTRAIRDFLTRRFG